VSLVPSPGPSALSAASTESGDQGFGDLRATFEQNQGDRDAFERLLSGIYAVAWPIVRKTVRGQQNRGDDRTNKSLRSADCKSVIDIDQFAQIPQSFRDYCASITRAYQEDIDFARCHCRRAWVFCRHPPLATQSGASFACDMLQAVLKRYE
jgi:hypothetical protein